MDEFCLQTPIWGEWLSYPRYLIPIIPKATNNLKEKSRHAFALKNDRWIWVTNFFSFLEFPQHYKTHQDFPLLSYTTTANRKKLTPTVKYEREKRDLKSERIFPGMSGWEKIISDRMTNVPSFKFKFLAFCDAAFKLYKCQLLLLSVLKAMGDSTGWENKVSPESREKESWNI